MNKQERKAKRLARQAEGKSGNGSGEDKQLAETLGIPVPEAEPETPTPEPEAKAEAEAETPPAEGGDPERDALAEMEELAAKIPDEESRNKLLGEIRKWHTEASRSNQVKAWKAFDEELKTLLPTVFTELATKHGVELVSRRITVTFPNGVFSHTNSVVGKGKGGGGGSREMPSRWTGKAKEGEQTHDSPNALALALGLKVTGHRDMIDVFESQGYKVTELPKCDRADKTIAKSEKERADRLTALTKEGGNFVVTKS